MIDLVVLAKTPAADGVVVVDLAAAGGGRLPAWRPGAHIGLVLPTGGGVPMWLSSRCGGWGGFGVSVVGAVAEHRVE
ncbi:hypothetical protein ACWED2_43125, partial [Amycolatopsis sp. NPDC005003]